MIANGETRLIRTSARCNRELEMNHLVIGSSAGTDIWRFSMYPIFGYWDCSILVLLDVKQSQINSECCRVLEKARPLGPVTNLDVSE